MSKLETLRDASPLSAPIRLSRKFDWFGMTGTADVEAECIDLARANADDIVAMCMEPETIRLAVMAADLAWSEKDNGPETSIYVIGAKDGDTCKIGIAKNPASRVRCLQTGFPHKFEIHALFWVLDSEPVSIEQAALRAAKGMGLRLSGEWVNGPAELGALFVASAIKTLNVRIADSAMMLRQREAIRNERRNWL